MPENKDMQRIEGKLDDTISLFSKINISVELLVQSSKEEKAVSKEHRVKVEGELKDLHKRIRDVELYQEGNKTTFSDFKIMRTSIIKWVVGSVLGFAAIAGTAVTIIITLQ